ncbi:putative cyclin-D7-1 [Punica granatum]|uniref:Cyclin-D7-1 n=1 Tax=Punica granatum TaxID=22663 RepID=A0A6P8C2A8_PUNGR|nr:putative cyclin-D7-1 [Punica granatum]
MESLLCDEKSWALTSPFHEASTEHGIVVNPGNIAGGGGSPASFYTTKEDVENALRICLDKETSYMPKAPGFAAVVESNDLTVLRFRVTQWLMKSKSRLRLSYGTLFLAVNYFDRFISACKCQEWKDWMVKLLSVACLSVASKSFETFTSFPLHEIQMEGLDHAFQPSTIQRMELILLRALEWRISSITPYTYVELLMWNLSNSFLLPNHLHEELRGRVHELLLLAVSDIQLTEFRPSVLAVSAMRYGLQEVLASLSDIHPTHFTKFIDQDQKENLKRCNRLMEERLKNHSFDPVILTSSHSTFNCSPLSPVTVLSTEGISIGYDELELSQFEMEVSRANQRSNRKNRKEQEYLRGSS